VRPYAGAVGDGFILMDDNARPHRARVVTDYLENETIERMELSKIYNINLKMCEFIFQIKSHIPIYTLDKKS
jgi:hypothetical protein